MDDCCFEVENESTEYELEYPDNEWEILRMGALLEGISFYRGDSYPIVIRVRDKVTQEYVDLTGFAFMLSVNTEDEPIDESTQLFTVDGVVDPDQVTNKGIVTFLPTSMDTDQAIDTYYFDIQSVSPEGYTRTHVKNKFVIEMEITKRIL